MNLGTLAIEYVTPDAVHPHPENARRGDVDAIAESIDVNGMYRPIIVQRSTGHILAGNHTYRAAVQHGEEQVPVVFLDVDEEQARRIMLADNRYADLGDYDDQALLDLLQGLPDLDGTGYDDEDLAALLQDLDDDPALDMDEDEAPAASLADRFGAPPFTTISARGGEWQERKRAWKATGIQSELGRADDLLYTSHINRWANWYDVKAAAEKAAGRTLTPDEVEASPQGKDLRPMAASQTSIFDPALTETLYRWHTRAGDNVLDPWAGGSVRGIVAAALGRNYHGIDLRPEQVEANRAQWDTIGERLRTDDTPPATPDYTPDLTPLEEHDGVWVKRDDLYRRAGMQGGKVRSCWHLATQDPQPAGLVTASSRHSPQAMIVAHVGQALGLPVRLHMPAGGRTPEMDACERAGAEIVQHKPGYNTVIVARAREDAEASGYRLIPFGMECREAVEATASQVRSLHDLPDTVTRLVMPVGSGMSLAGVLHGLQREGIDLPVLGVVVGADPRPRLAAYAPKGWEKRVTLVDATKGYEDAVQAAVGGLVLDPHYEAKCAEHLQAGDALWVVGIRADTTPPPTAVGTPEWVVGDSRERLKDVPDESQDFIIGCPPYYDLETYSDDPADLSNLTTEEFDQAMADTLTEAARALRPDRFAAFVVGNVRDKAGNLRSMHRCMVNAAEAAGLHYTQDAVLLTPIGSARVVAARAFGQTRALARTHQEILVFVKGDRRAAAQRLGDVDLAASIDAAAETVAVDDAEDTAGDN